ncbi:MAG: 4Fe-4S binding protein [Crenarchaeota archaeon]|nr:4Fe-4S binding protein [Thermoproteota archaeon]
MVNEVTIVAIFVAIVVVGIVAILKLTKDKTRRVSHLRLFIQISAVFVIFMGLLIGPFNDPVWAPLGSSPRDRLIGGDLLGNQLPDGISLPVLACYMPNGRTITCPIFQIQASIFPFWDASIGYNVFYATSGLERLVIVFAALIFASLLLGRFFCGWLCPFGLYMDLLTRVRKVFKKRHLNVSPTTSKKLSQSRYIIIAVFLLLSVIFGSYSIFGTELILGTNPTAGHDVVHSGIITYINEPFCLVCPMRPLCIGVECLIGSMNWSYVSQIAYGPFWIAGFYITSINLSILIAITVLSLAYRRFWCRICPLGALTGFFSTFTPFKQIALTKLYKNEEKCTKCGVCKRVCPTQATAVYETKGGDVTESRCILCARCVETCPYETALELKFAGKTVMKSRNWL